MKWPISTILLALALFLTRTSFGQTNQAGHLIVPFLDSESQSNVTVSVCDWDGQPCPADLTNSLSNLNLFTPEQQTLIREAFTKYKTVTTNSGPSGTVLAGFFRTNNIIGVMGQAVNDERFISHFQYTNSGAYEDITFGHGMLAQYRTHSGSRDGYFVSFTPVADGTLMSFGGIKHDRPDGMMARFDDGHSQGATWNYRLSDFNGSGLAEYIQYTNGLVLGKFLIWDPQSGKLIMAANFQTPYDYGKHRTDLPKTEIH